MSEVDDESLYSFGSGQPDDTRAADSTSYSTEWAPLPASGGASPRARSPRSDGASMTAALSFSTAAVSADAALDDADEVESVAAPGDDEPPVEEEEEDVLDRLRRGAAAIQARRGADDASPSEASYVADDEPAATAEEEEPQEEEESQAAAEEEDILDRVRLQQAPLQDALLLELAAVSGGHQGVNVLALTLCVLLLLRADGGLLLLPHAFVHGVELVRSGVRRQDLVPQPRDLAP